MDGFGVARWRRHGQDRLYVNRTEGGKAVGWYDLKSHQLVITDESSRTAVVEALTPHLPDVVFTPAPAAAPEPAAMDDIEISPAGDLASNQPGDALRRKIAQLEPTLWKRVFARWLSNETTEAHSWAVGLAGERLVGGRLNRLRRGGWKVLHSIQLPSGSDIDHLVIGPPGVFTVNTKHHKGKSVWQGDHAITVNRSTTRYLPISESEAERVGRVLSARSGFLVPVRPVLAVVGAASVTTKSALPPVVLLVDGSRVDQRLSGLTPVLAQEQVDALFAVARQPQTWMR
ncbi:nuclease-related domain-containing protein [Kitasatospora sp. GAS204B]|uniref:nuclease-related domain-containing protein n=1 Tax=unclassified Kitasatospora TaxID=2633591 RepID=UPI002474650A|nr:nuclease-related domain-containing protein [Kitasatospora sp. GAS204B]MDH6116831.1 hypothetical protein [Kitasatospora sp. GAS204B]